VGRRTPGSRAHRHPRRPSDAHRLPATSGSP
jgi:hypothetical protein